MLSLMHRIRNLKREVKITLGLLTTLLLLLSLSALLLQRRVILLDRSESIAGDLSTGGWLVERDSFGVVYRGFSIFFKDGTMISNNLTYERIVPYEPVGKDTISLVVEGVHPEYITMAVKVSKEDGLVGLTAPVPADPGRWTLYMRKVVEDTSAGDTRIELRGRWRVFSASIFDINNFIRDGDSGVVEFFGDGRAEQSIDRPAEISHGFPFPEVRRYTVSDNILRLLKADGQIVEYRIHSLGELMVLERDEKIPWILVPAEG